MSKHPTTTRADEHQTYPAIRYVTTGFFTLVWLGAVTKHFERLLSDETGPSNANYKRTLPNKTETGRAMSAEAVKRSVTGTWPVRRNVIGSVLSTGH